MYIDLYINIDIDIYIHIYPPDPKIIYVHFLHISGNFFTYRSVQKFQSCAEDQMLQDLIVPTRLCGTGFITQNVNMVESFISA